MLKQSWKLRTLALFLLCVMSTTGHNSPHKKGKRLRDTHHHAVKNKIHQSNHKNHTSSHINNHKITNTSKHMRHVSSNNTSNNSTRKRSSINGVDEVCDPSCIQNCLPTCKFQCCKTEATGPPNAIVGQRSLAAIQQVQGVGTGQQLQGLTATQQGQTLAVNHKESGIAADQQIQALVAGQQMQGILSKISQLQSAVSSAQQQLPTETFSHVPTIIENAQITGNTQTTPLQAQVLQQGIEAVPSIISQYNLSQNENNENKLLAGQQNSELNELDQLVQTLSNIEKEEKAESNNASKKTDVKVQKIDKKKKATTSKKNNKKNNVKTNNEKTSYKKSKTDSHTSSMQKSATKKSPTKGNHQPTHKISYAKQETGYKKSGASDDDQMIFDKIETLQNEIAEDVDSDDFLNIDNDVIDVKNVPETTVEIQQHEKNGEEQENIDDENVSLIDTSLDQSEDSKSIAFIEEADNNNVNKKSRHKNNNKIANVKPTSRKTSSRANKSNSMNIDLEIKEKEVPTAKYKQKPTGKLKPKPQSHKKVDNHNRKLHVLGEEDRTEPHSNKNKDHDETLHYRKESEEENEKSNEKQTKEEASSLIPEYTNKHHAGNESQSLGVVVHNEKSRNDGEDQGEKETERHKEFENTAEHSGHIKKPDSYDKVLKGEEKLSTPVEELVEKVRHHSHDEEGEEEYQHGFTDNIKYSQSEGANYHREKDHALTSEKFHRRAKNKADGSDNHSDDNDSKFDGDSDHTLTHETLREHAKYKKEESSGKSSQDGGINEGEYPNMKQLLQTHQEELKKKQHQKLPGISEEEKTSIQAEEESEQIDRKDDKNHSEKIEGKKSSEIDRDVVSMHSGEQELPVSNERENGPDKDVYAKDFNHHAQKSRLHSQQTKEYEQESHKFKPSKYTDEEGESHALKPSKYKDEDEDEEEGHTSKQFKNAVHDEIEESKRLTEQLKEAEPELIGIGGKIVKNLLRVSSDNLVSKFKPKSNSFSNTFSPLNLPDKNESIKTNHRHLIRKHHRPSSKHQFHRIMHIKQPTTAIKHHRRATAKKFIHHHSHRKHHRIHEHMIHSKFFNNLKSPDGDGYQCHKDCLMNCSPTCRFICCKQSQNATEQTSPINDIKNNNNNVKLNTEHAGYVNTQNLRNKELDGKPNVLPSPVNYANGYVVNNANATLLDSTSNNYAYKLNSNALSVNDNANNGWNVQNSSGLGVSSTLEPTHQSLFLQNEHTKKPTGSQEHFNPHFKSLFLREQHAPPTMSGVTRDQKSTNNPTVAALRPTIVALNETLHSSNVGHKSLQDTKKQLENLIKVLESSTGVTARRKLNKHTDCHPQCKRECIPACKFECCRDH